MDRQTDRRTDGQTDTTENITYPHSRVVTREDLTQMYFDSTSTFSDALNLNVKTQQGTPLAWDGWND